MQKMSDCFAPVFKAKNPYYIIRQKDMSYNTRFQMAVMGEPFYKRFILKEDERCR